MSFVMIVGLLSFLMHVLLWRSCSCAVVRVIIRASIAEQFLLHQNSLWARAPVISATSAIRSANIFSSWASGNFRIILYDISSAPAAESSFLLRIILSTVWANTWCTVLLRSCELGGRNPLGIVGVLATLVGSNASRRASHFPCKLLAPCISGSFILFVFLSTTARAWWASPLFALWSFSSHNFHWASRMAVFHCRVASF